MNNYPKPFIGEPDGRWPDDLAEDYRNASSDDERRRMLLDWGVDVDHQQEARRLFSQPETTVNRKNNGVAPQLEELQKYRQDVDKYRTEETADQAAKALRKKHVENRNFLKIVLSSVVSGIIVAIFSYYWPSIVSFLTNLIQKLSPP